jgi:hypothetical protein
LLLIVSFVLSMIGCSGRVWNYDMNFMEILSTTDELCALLGDPYLCTFYFLKAYTYAVYVWSSFTLIVYMCKAMSVMIYRCDIIYLYVRLIISLKFRCL